MPLFHQRIKPQLVLAPLILESGCKNMNNWWGNGIKIQLGDCSQEYSDLLRQLTMVPRLRGDLSTIVIRFNTDPVWDILNGSHTGLKLSSDSYGRYLFFLFHGGPVIDLGLSTDLLGLKQSRPAIKSPRKSQTT